MTRPLLDRITEKLDFDENGCFIFTGGKTSSGYGAVVLDSKKQKLVHRAMYELVVGKIPDGLTLDHLCRVRACCNPDHLEPVTMLENLRRGEGLVGINFRKTHCDRGHELSGENLYVTLDGKKRRCRTCDKATRKRRTERERLKKE